MVKTNFAENFDVDTIVGKSIEVQGKILHPIVKVSILKDNKMTIVGSWIIPVAFVIEENGKKYVISLNDEKINQNELLKMI
ncbi:MULTISPECIES: hypothetical protein [Methanobacterium]|uniref:Uncharacterized protein n=1 Tax=Methanobacterium bryantii TaxID=2161 RepID=A0A2A2H9Z8_METBR|nr:MULTISPECIES: hypothetical protein [Methanobacterium]OEC87044.1 hypothetical protein A9507_09115 [Methanobacterium sp. A39]PAV06110.1 hypothetical protein ASJ80_14860 [Methanobacterium bryantii]